MSFHRKHYELIARPLARIEDDATRLSVANTLAEMLKKDNPLFDYARFHEAIKAEFDFRKVSKRKD